MSEFIQHYSLKYTPLSPIHIGANESFEPGNYVIDIENDALYGFDHHSALAGLSPQDRTQLLAIVNGKADDSLLTKVQAFFHNHREQLIPFSRAPIPTAAGIRALYEKRIGKTAQHEGQGKRVINKLEIERTFYNPVDQSPLLPGSSIKGAIRTAILDQLRQDSMTSGDHMAREKSRELQARLMQGQIHTDPMRLIAIGDAFWQGSPDNPACQIQFAVNRKRKVAMKNGAPVKSQAETRGLYQLLECITASHIHSFNGSLTLHDTRSVRHNAAKLPYYQWTMKEIAQYCNAFYMHLFWQEINAMREHNYLKTQWLEQTEQLFSADMLKRMNDGEAFLLRIGRHSGAEAMTLNEIRSIKIMQGNKPPRWQAQPTTWWLAAEQEKAQSGMLPFGWVLIEIDPAQPDPALQNWLAGQNEKTAWFQAQLQKQQQLKQEAQQRQALEEQGKQAEREREQQERLKQAQEQQRLASLSPLERELEAFLQNIQPQEHDTRLLKELETGRWQDDEARIVAEKIKALMEEAGKWMPDFGGTNKKKLKLKARSQRVLRYLS